ncbi:sugar porter family MFS transporter [Poronia punctata]|nr:sugar porter family MFS transporter [Poronia punctata]
MVSLPFLPPSASGYCYFSALYVCIGSLLWGYDSGVFSTAQAQTYFTYKFHPSPAVLGGIISIYTAGGAIGCLLSVPLGDRIGRRGTLGVGAIIAIIGTALQTAAQEVVMLVFGRLVAGLAIGIIYFAIPMFQSEIAPATHRGLFVGLHAQFVGVGYMLSNWVGYGVSFSEGELPYRLSVGLQILWAIFLSGSIFLIPESPRYLIKKGRTEEAEIVMRRLRKSTSSQSTSPSPSPSHQNIELEQMKSQIRWESENEETALLAILRKPSYRRRIFLASGVQIAQQICGISAINYYQTTMYRSLGIRDNHTVLLLAGIWGITGPLANIFCLAFIIDRVNRRTLLFWGSVGMTVDIIIVQVFVAVYGGEPDNKIANAFGIFFLILFGIIFSLSWNSGSPVYTTEVFPTQIRALGGGIATFWSFVVQVVLAQASPVGLGNVGWRYYFFFIACNLAIAVGVYVFLPETKGKTLEEISEIFGDVFVAGHMDGREKTREEGVNVSWLQLGC